MARELALSPIPTEEPSMNLNQGKLAQALVDRLLENIHEFDDTLYMSTVLGVLEIVKQLD
jgi:hypothetical protein